MKIAIRRTSEARVVFLNKLASITLVMQVIAAIDAWRGITEDDHLAPEIRLRSGLGLDAVQSAALTQTLQNQGVPVAPQAVTACVQMALDGDASLAELAQALDEARVVCRARRGVHRRA